MRVGMLRALNQRGIDPNLLVGTSAGALNVAYLARPAADRLDRLDEGLSRRTFASILRVAHNQGYPALVLLVMVRVKRRPASRRDPLITGAVLASQHRWGVRWQLNALVLLRVDRTRGGRWFESG
jgi:predicted acylesterase/phospholipase RssA